jgi:hypothetical protein
MVDPRFRSELREVVGRLQQMQSVLAVAITSLREQSADIDADVATLLQCAVADGLQRQVDKLQVLLRRLPPIAAGPPRRRTRSKR